MLSTPSLNITSIRVGGVTMSNMMRTCIRFAGMDSNPMKIYGNPLNIGDEARFCAIVNESK